MKLLRRALVALGLIGATAALLRKQKAALPPQEGGWRELTGPDLR